MANMLTILTLITTVVLMTEGANSGFRKILNHRDSFVKPTQLPQNVVERFITQRLDNFDPTNDDTWQQRYMINGEFYQPGGCIFLLLTGNWEASADRLQNSMMYEMSREFQCYMVYLEHRYYGQSRPTDDTSNENLRYLSVEQVLADTAHFVEFLKMESVTPGAEESPVVVLGRRYAGSLAIWFRQSYPHLSIGAWSSSSPTQSVVDYFQFKELAGAVYRHVGGNTCYNRIERGFADMEEMVANGQQEILSNMFHLCYPIESEQDIQFFFYAMSDFYSSLTQFERATDIADVCDTILSNETMTDAEALAVFIGNRLDGECLTLDYDQEIYEERQTGWNDSAVLRGDRQWIYQQCTQLGWYRSSGSRFQPFGSMFPVEFIFRTCEDIFDDLFSPNLMLENSARFNAAFGGVLPRATNVLYVHGEFDPWRTVGVQTDDHQHESVTVIVIEGATQSRDIGPIADADSDAVRTAKETIIETIGGWISASAPTEIQSE